MPALSTLVRPFFYAYSVISTRTWMYFAVALTFFYDNKAGLMESINTRSLKPFLSDFFHSMISSDQTVFEGVQMVVSGNIIGFGLIVVGLIYLVFYVRAFLFIMNDILEIGIPLFWGVPMALGIMYLGMLAFDAEPFKGVIALAENSTEVIEGYNHHFVGENSTVGNLTEIPDWVPEVDLLGNETSGNVTE